jgi:hypothetical protein
MTENISTDVLLSHISLLNPNTYTHRGLNCRHGDNNITWPVYPDRLIQAYKRHLIAVRADRQAFADVDELYFDECTKDKKRKKNGKEKTKEVDPSRCCCTLLICVPRSFSTLLRFFWRRRRRWTLHDAVRLPGTDEIEVVHVCV